MTLRQMLGTGTVLILGFASTIGLVVALKDQVHVYLLTFILGVWMAGTIVLSLRLFGPERIRRLPWSVLLWRARFFVVGLGFSIGVRWLFDTFSLWIALPILVIVVCVLYLLNKQLS